MRQQGELSLDPLFIEGCLFFGALSVLFVTFYFARLPNARFRGYDPWISYPCLGDRITPVCPCPSGCGGPIAAKLSNLPNEVSRALSEPRLYGALKPRPDGAIQTSDTASY